MSEHVILVAVVVDTPESRDVAELWLHERLNRPAFRNLNEQRTDYADDAAEGEPYVDSWWIAEDDRQDGSDCDSAVFVPMGQQRRALIPCPLHDDDD